MIFRRFSAWLSLKLAAPSSETDCKLPVALDPDEFTRLLYSGDPADLGQIAQDLSISDPAVVRKQIRDRVSISKSY